jgi:hypothetical protein
MVNQTERGRTDFVLQSKTEVEENYKETSTRIVRKYRGGEPASLKRKYRTI